MSVPSTPSPRAGQTTILLIVLAIASALAGVAGLEGAARLYARVTNQGRGISFDRDLGWKPLPLVRKVGSVWGVRRPASTNSRGWRDPERSIAKPPGVRRAVAIGDSFTFGADVDDGERFTDRLNEGPDHLEVINLGVAGYGTDQELRVLETEGLRYQPDVVILTICLLNDFDDIGYERLYSLPKPYYALENGQLHLRPPSATWWLRARDWSYLLEFLTQRLMGEAAKQRRAAGFTDADAAGIFDALIQRIAAVTAEHGARLVATLAYPPKGRAGSDETMLAERRREAVETLDRARVPYIDTRVAFAAQSSDPDTRFYSPRGWHWNADGNAVVADAIRGLLAREESR